LTRERSTEAPVEPRFPGLPTVSVATHGPSREMACGAGGALVRTGAAAAAARGRRHASRAFLDGLAGPALAALVSSPNRMPFEPSAAGTALVSWPYRMEFDPGATGPDVRGTRPSPAPPGFEPGATGPNAGGVVWGSDRPIPESETRPSIGS